jgi:hypothetical protein
MSGSLNPVKAARDRVKDAEAKIQAAFPGLLPLLRDYNRTVTEFQQLQAEMFQAEQEAIIDEIARERG